MTQRGVVVVLDHESVVEGSIVRTLAQVGFELRARLSPALRGDAVVLVHIRHPGELTRAARIAAWTPVVALTPLDLLPSEARPFAAVLRLPCAPDDVVAAIEAARTPRRPRSHAPTATPRARDSTDPGGA